MIRIVAVLSVVVVACKNGEDMKAVVARHAAFAPQLEIAAGRFLATTRRCLQDPDTAVLAISPGDASAMDPGDDMTPTELPAFAIDRDRVSSDEFTKCVEAGKCPGLANSSANEEGVDVVAIVNLPSAKAYCSWLGMQLPSALEWQRSARGRIGDAYPPGWPERSSTCPSTERLSRGPFPRECVFNSPEGMQYVMHSFFEWTRDEGCSPIDEKSAKRPLVVRLSESRLDLTMQTEGSDMGTFRCVHAL